MESIGFGNRHHDLLVASPKEGETEIPIMLIE